MGDGDKTVIVQQTAPASLVELDRVLLERVERAWDFGAYEFTGNEILRTKKLLALKGFAMRGIISEGARMAGVARKTWYQWTEDDPEFERAAKDGKAFALETLEAMAFTRGYAMSDRLLEFMLKYGKPQTYRDTVAHVGPNGEALPPTLTQVNVSPVLIIPDNGRGDAPVAPPVIAEPKPEVAP